MRMNLAKAHARKQAELSFCRINVQAMLPDADHGTTFPTAVVMKGTHDSNSISSPGHSRRIHVQQWKDLATDGATLKVEMPGGAQQWRWSSACEH